MGAAVSTIKTYPALTAKAVASQARANTTWRGRLEPQQARAAASQGYVRATERERCETCLSCVSVVDLNRYTVNCTRGGFEVNRLGWCTKWEKAHA